MAREKATKGIDGIGELVIMAPIKPGFIDAYENITYESRLRAVAEAMFKIECNAREHEPFTPFADVAERILTVFNFRIGILDRNLAKIKPGVKRQDGTMPIDIEPQRMMFLIATYDGPFEPYLRLIWDPLGPFLDLLLCNCVGYKLSSETGFPEYIAWVRDHLVDSSIFYTTTSNTLKDQLYLSDLERKQRERDPIADCAKSDSELAELVATSAQQKADAVWGEPGNPNKAKIREALRLSLEALNVLFRLTDFYPPHRDDAKILLKATQDLLLGLAEKVEEFLRVQSTDEDVLIAQETLRQSGVTHKEGGAYGPFTDHWYWFTGATSTPLQVPAEPPEGGAQQGLIDVSGEVQRGLIDDYDDGEFRTTHGLTLLFAITDAAKAGDLIIRDFPISWAGEPAEPSDWDRHPIKFFGNVAFTAPGLRKMAVPAAELARFPKEFRDGMFQRAPMNGDTVWNHPRRWDFPPRFNPATGQDDPRRPTIHSEEIDVILQLRIASRPQDEPEPGYIDFEDRARTLEQTLSRGVEGAVNLLAQFDQLASGGIAKILDVLAINRLGTILKDAVLQPNGLREAADKALEDTLKKSDPLAVLALFHMRRTPHPDPDRDPGLLLLAVESTFRPVGPYAGKLPAGSHDNRDHFGFVDGISQPKPVQADPAASPAGYDDRVPFGDILFGHPNSRADSVEDQFWYDTDNSSAARKLLQNGSFMVMRKIAQYRDRLQALGGPESAVAHAIVGRTHDGAPLKPDHAHKVNDFDFTDDPKQAHTPFSSHIRLANPRDEFQKRPAPRILRRGMAYGDRFDPNDPQSASKQRGVLFIAYNASIAEQYEVIQRWLNRGNPTGVSSAANDPLTGAAPKEGSLTFRYIQDGKVQRAKIEQPLTQLLWGLYAFAPSKTALELICGVDWPADYSDERNEGLDTIARIEALPKREQQRAEWKRILEDFFVKDGSDLGQMPPVWRAIRDAHGGVFRIECGLPYGGGKARYKVPVGSDEGPVVLVADKQHILEIMANSRDFSSSERMVRAKASIGVHYVAMDPVRPDGLPNLAYVRESAVANAILLGISELKQDEVFDGAYEAATRVLNKIKGSTVKRDYYKVDFRRIFLANALGGLCQGLFDIPNADPKVPDEGHIDREAWGWRPVDLAGNTTAAQDMRKPRCPADFMSPSRFSFYPRPTCAVQDYAVEHGKGLSNAAHKLVDELREKDAGNPGTGFKGAISKQFSNWPLPRMSNDLLTRNILGSMTGAIPPLDATMRGILYEWINEASLWQHQTEYLKFKAQSAKSDKKKSPREYTEAAIGKAIKTAMCKRPSPDLLYRTANRDTQINGVPVKAGEMVILGLISPMLESLDRDDPDLDVVFGGERKSLAGALTHACPARSMVMAILYGLWAALFDAGRIVAQPASLILQITDWEGPRDNAPIESDDLVFDDFPSLDLPADFEAQLKAKFEA